MSEDVLATHYLGRLVLARRYYPRYAAWSDSSTRSSVWGLKAMLEYYIYVKLLDGREAERQLMKLLRRHRGRIVAVALVVEAESQQQAAGLARGYGLRAVRLSPELLLVGRDVWESAEGESRAIKLLYKWVEVKDYDVAGCLVEVTARGCRLAYLKLVTPGGGEIYVSMLRGIAGWQGRPCGWSGLLRSPRAWYSACG